jgi:hypothetical protein
MSIESSNDLAELWTSDGDAARRPQRRLRNCDAHG